MYAFRSLLLTAITLLVSANFANAVTNHLYKCDLPAQYSVQGKHVLHKAQLTVSIPDHRGYRIYTYPGSRTISFEVEPVVVTFNGKTANYPEKSISQTFHQIISGVAQHLKMNSTDSDISDCHAYMLPWGVQKNHVSDDIAKDIIDRAEECINYLICLKLSKMTVHYKESSTGFHGLAKLPGLTGPNPYVGTFFGLSPFENALNTLVDSGLRNLIVSFKAIGQGEIYVPKISSHLRDADTIRGRFQADSGTFKNMSTIERFRLPMVSHDGMQFAITTKLVIKEPELNYMYTLHLGTSTTRGEMKATIDGMNLEARLVVDYTSIPCRVRLDSIKVTDVGKLNYHLTNLKPKSAITKNWITEKDLHAIKEKIEQNIHDTTRTVLNYYSNCEQYRP